MPDPSAGEVGGIFAGLVALAIAIGKGLGWLLNWEDRRRETRHAKLDAWQKELQARERELDRKQDDYHRVTEERLAELTSWAADLQKQHAALANAFHLVAAALRSKDPDSPALHQSNELLKIAFPVDPIIPASLVGLIRQADGIDEGTST